MSHWCLADGWTLVDHNALSQGSSNSFPAPSSVGRYGAAGTSPSLPLGLVQAQVAGQILTHKHRLAAC